MPKIESIKNEHEYGPIKFEHDPENETENEIRRSELREIDEKIAEISSAISNCESYVEEKIKDAYLLNSLKAIKKGVIDLSILLDDNIEMKVAECSNLTDNLGQLDAILGIFELLKRRISVNGESISGNEKKLLENFISRIEEVEKYVKNLIKDGLFLKKELATHEEKHNPDK